MTAAVGASPGLSGRGVLLAGLSGVAGFVVGYASGALKAAEPYLAKSFVLIGAQGTLADAIPLAAAILSPVLAGGLASRFAQMGRLHLAASAGALAAAGVAVLVTAHGFAAILIGRALVGLGSGAVVTVALIELADRMTPAARGRGLALLPVMIAAGFAAAGAVGDHTIGIVEHAAGSLNAPALALVEDRAWRIIAFSAFYPAVAFALAAGVVAHSGAALGGPGPAGPGRGLSSFARPFGLACGVAILVQIGGFGALPEVAAAVITRAGFGPGRAAHRADALTSVLALSCVAGLVLADAIPRRLHLRLGCGGAAMALAAAATLFFGMESGLLPAGAASGNAVDCCLMAFLVCAAAGPYVCSWVLLGELLPRRMRAAGIGLGLAAGILTRLAAPALYLAAVKRFGDAGTLGICAIAALVCYGAASRLLPETRGLSAEEVEAAFPRAGIEEN